MKLTCVQVLPDISKYTSYEGRAQLLVPLYVNFLKSVNRSLQREAYLVTLLLAT